jgi:hypothetical protein
MALCLVGFAAVRVALHRSARSRGYKLSREEADPMSLEWRWCVVLIEMGSSYCCLIVSSPLDMALTSPFITSKWRARVIFAVKW